MQAKLPSLLGSRADTFGNQQKFQKLAQDEAEGEQAQQPSGPGL